MKKLSLFAMLLMMGGLFFITSCDDDDNDDPTPQFTVAASSEAVTVGYEEMVTLEFTITASNTIKELNVNVDGSGTASIANESELIGATSGTASVSYTAPNSDDNVTVELTVTDNTNEQKSASTAVTVGKAVVNYTASDKAQFVDGDFLPNTTYNLAQGEYLFDGLVYIEEGAELNIAAGTIIKFTANPSTADNASALIITRGAKIIAEGTSSDPIIMTAELDDLAEGVLDNTNVGLWGGLLVLGKAPTYKKGADEVNIEGIPSDEPRGLYGGTDEADNSGVMRYLSIRYTGIGFQPGDELQGLTLGGVGNGTTIDYIDIYVSGDDGIEIFGGTVNIKHVAVAFSTDDDFDLDLGYRGNAQFLFSVMRTDTDGYDHAGEWDGASPDDAPLYSRPNIANLTTIGPGTSATGRDKAFLMREHYTGYLVNSVIASFPSKGLEVQDLGCDATVDSYSEIGSELFIQNNTWSSIGTASQVEDLIKITSKDGDDNPITPCDPDASDLIAHLTDNNNVVTTDLLVGGVSIAKDGGLDPRTTSKLGDLAANPDAWFETVDYRGAFDPDGATWLAGWSSLSKFGYLVD